MAKPPIPETKTAWLPSRGYDGLRATRHTYVKTVATSYPGLQEKTWDDVWEFVFACDDTGAERPWGFEAKLLAPTVPLGKVN